MSNYSAGTISPDALSNPRGAVYFQIKDYYGLEKEMDININGSRYYPSAWELATYPQYFPTATKPVITDDKGTEKIKIDPMVIIIGLIILLFILRR